MQLYLPIAGFVINIWSVILLGCFTGFLSGFLGIGGGIVANPVMIFFGIPSNVVIGTSSFQLLGTSFAGTLCNLRRKTVDIKVGVIMGMGGLIGSTFGVKLLVKASSCGVADIAVSVMFAAMMLIIIVPMYFDAIRGIIARFSMRRIDVIAKGNFGRKSEKSSMMNVYSGVANVYYNPVVVFVVGSVVGLVGGFLGIGGALFSVPVMSFLMGIEFRFASATSLFQVFMVSLNTMFWQCQNNNVDIVLGIGVLCSSAITVQIGAIAQSKVQPWISKVVFSLLITVILFLFLFRLYSEPVSKIIAT
ncbi:sulfite exporter TauE/SafE family protein [Rickettsiales bacterium]|nr:sulfite exporter TauE/SafE family protein [Rickettsiales bacterium]